MNQEYIDFMDRQEMEKSMWKNMNRKVTNKMTKYINRRKHIQLKINTQYFRKLLESTKLLKCSLF